MSAPLDHAGIHLDDAKLRRAGMDYRDGRRSPSIPTWRPAPPPSPAAGHDAHVLYTDPAYEPGDVLLFGPESVGLPDEVQHHPWVSEWV